MEAIILFFMSLFTHEELAVERLLHESKRTPSIIYSDIFLGELNVLAERQVERTLATKLIAWHLSGIKYVREENPSFNGHLSHAIQQKYLPLGLNISEFTSIKDGGYIFTFGQKDALFGIIYSEDALLSAETELGRRGITSGQKWPGEITVINLNNNGVMRGQNYIAPPSFSADIVLITEIG